MTNLGKGGGGILSGFLQYVVYFSYTPKKDLEQKVGPGILGVNGLSVSKQGKFRTNDGLGKRNISVQFQQGKATISVKGVMDGELIPLL